MATELHRKNGSNWYKIVNEQNNHVQLKCTWFCAEEDLGDGIYCTHEGQSIWVSKYFSDHMIREEINV